ncbi:YncE family protein, partial [Bacillus anthracis]|nr:YncE family protein [Bacillus anthracis]
MCYFTIITKSSEDGGNLLRKSVFLICFLFLLVGCQG